MAKHCVPAVPAKRISITFRRMDESKRPSGYAPEPDLEGLQPLLVEADRSRKYYASRPRRSSGKPAVGRGDRMDHGRRLIVDNTDARYSGRIRQGHGNRRRFRANSEN